MPLTENNVERLRVYVDFDDVLCETARLLMDVALREFGRDLVFEEIGSFDIGEAFKLTNHEVRRVMDLLHDPDLLMSLAPMPDARETLTHWVGNGVQIDIVTGRPPSTKAASQAWLTQHNIPYANLIFVNKYARQYPNLCGESSMSLEELRQCDYGLAVEDAPHMLQFLIEEMMVDVAVFHRPWNSRTPLPTRQNNRKVKRCHGWQDVAKQFPLAK